MQHRVERAPGLEPDQPGDVRPEDRRPRRGQHQQYRHRKRADIEALEHDLQQRHPGLGLPADRPVGRDGLGFGAGFRVSPQGRRVAGLGRPLLAGVVDRVQHHLLAHDLARRARGPDEEVVGGRQGGEQLGPGQGFRPRVREYPPPEHRAGAGDLGVPPGVQPSRPVLAGDDPAVDRPSRRLPTAACRVANSNMRAGEAPADGVPPAVTSPQMSVLSRRSSAEMWPSSRAWEHALAGIVADVAREHRVGDLQPGRGGREPGPEDQPVAPVGEIVRQGEGLFGQARQPVADLGGERREQGEPDRHVGHHRRRQWPDPSGRPP